MRTDLQNKFVFAGEHKENISKIISQKNCNPKSLPNALLRFPFQVYKQQHKKQLRNQINGINIEKS